MLDYLPLNSAPDKEAVAKNNGESETDASPNGRRVLAINPQSTEIERIRETLRAADLADPSRISFRPLAPLSLAETIVPTNGAPGSDATKRRALFVTLQEQHADMLLMEGQQLLLNRSIRLPQQGDQVFVEALVDEIRRTDLVAPASSATTDTVDSVAPSIGQILAFGGSDEEDTCCLLYTSPSPRDATLSRMPSSA